jgi:FKBP-type peptidyl-prolyl cis-trans isomerase FkpA
VIQMISRSTDPGRAVALALCLAGVLALGGCAPPAVQAPVAAEDQATELQAQDLVVGQGAVAAPGSTVTVHYTGWLYDRDAPEQKGRQFDSSRGATGRPFSFTLGARQVIAGWDEGVAGMRVGGQRRLVIPSALGYGDQGAGGVIPPKATLVFDVELLEVKPAGR